MISKVAILFAVFAAVSSTALVSTGISSISRVMDGHGNYAFEYGIESAGAKRARAEVGNGYSGALKSSYAVTDTHIAPVAPAVVAAPAVLAAPTFAAAPLGLAHPGVIGLGGHGLVYRAGLVGGHGLGLVRGHDVGLVGGHGLGLLGAGKLLL